MPLYLQLEYFLGIVLARLVAQDRLVLMRLAQQVQQRAQQQAEGAAAAGEEAGATAEPR